MTPVTFMGKLVSGMCAVTGIFILTLPIPIVVTSFASCYKNRLWRNEIVFKKRILKVTTNMNQEDLVGEKRNLFADLAGVGGFYIKEESGLEDDCDFSLITDSPTSALSLSPIDPRRTPTGHTS